MCEATKKNPAILSDPTELPVQFQCNMVCTPGVITSIPCLLMVCCIPFEPRREATNCYLSIILIKFCFKIAKFARKCYRSYGEWRVESQISVQIKWELLFSHKNDQKKTNMIWARSIVPAIAAQHIVPAAQHVVPQGAQHFWAHKRIVPAKCCADLSTKKRYDSSLLD